MLGQVEYSCHLAAVGVSNVDFISSSDPPFTGHGHFFELILQHMYKSIAYRKVRPGQRLFFSQRSSGHDGDLTESVQY